MSVCPFDVSTTLYPCESIVLYFNFVDFLVNLAISYLQSETYPLFYPLLEAQPLSLLRFQPFWGVLNCDRHNPHPLTPSTIDNPPI